MIYYRDLDEVALDEIADELFEGMLGWSANHAVQLAYINADSQEDGVYDALFTAYTEAGAMKYGPKNLPNDLVAQATEYANTSFAACYWDEEQEVI